MTRSAVLALLLVGCSSTTEVELQLDGANSCTPLALTPVTHVSVQVWGVDATANACTLASRCITLDDRPTSVDDIERALRDATQPLVDIEAEGANQVAIVGHRTPGCAPGDQDLCGVADLADADTGVLTVEVVCELIIIDDQCGSDRPPLCP